jgi:hypothetical protein
MKSGAARTFQKRCLAIECAQTLIAFARPQTKRSKHNRKDRQENERENATCGALIALVLDPHKRDAYSRHTLLAGLALEFAAARAATSKRAIRETIFLFFIVWAGSLVLDRNSKLSIRMVSGHSELIAAEQFLVAEARYVPNTQFLSIPFRSQLIHGAA